jgi:hypothetical protein
LTNLIDIGGSLFLVGVPISDAILFKSNKPYRFCFICGAVWQTARCRKVNKTTNDRERLEVARQGKHWAERHSQVHTLEDHEKFKRFGPDAFPEAANRLVAFGIINLSQDMEIKKALLESSPIPTDDCEG